MMELFKSSIKCSICVKILESPVILQCGQSVCKKHTLNSNCQQNATIYCLVCDVDHQIPNDGYLSNTALENIIKSRVHDMEFGKEHSQASESCQNLSEAIEEILQLEKDPYFFIHEVIGRLKDQIELKREDLKMKIDQEAMKFINEIENYDIECKNNLKSNEYQTKSNQLGEKIKMISVELEKWMKNLDTFKIDQEEWTRIIEKSRLSIVEIEKSLKSAKTDLLLNKFEEFQSKILEFNKYEVQKGSMAMNGGKTFKIKGYVPSNSTRFSFNLCELGSYKTSNLVTSNIQLHLDVRFNESVILFNIRKDGIWGNGKKTGSNPIRKGNDFEVAIQIESDQFKIFVNGVHFAVFERVPCFSEEPHFINIDEQNPGKDVIIYSIGMI